MAFRGLEDQGPATRLGPPTKNFPLKEGREAQSLEILFGVVALGLISRDACIPRSGGLHVPTMGSVRDALILLNS